jgi:hypothetical protein
MKDSTHGTIPAPPSASPRDFATVDVMAVRELPHSLEEVDNLRKAITAKLWLDFYAKLSDAEKKSLKNVECLYPVLGKWDCYILEAAQQYGARLLLTDLVMDRVWSWQCGEKDGAHKLKSLFHEIHRSALVGLRQAKGRITDRHRGAKKDFVRELVELQIRVRKDWPETPDDIRLCVAAAIVGEGALFQYLKKNKGSLLLFLCDDQIAMKFRGADFKRVKGDLTPARFYDQWVASTENRDPESVRHDLISL